MQMIDALATVPTVVYDDTKAICNALFQSAIPRNNHEMSEQLIHFMKSVESLF